MSAVANLYRSQTDRTEGWWVASVPTSAGCRIVKVLRDVQGEAKVERIMRAAAAEVPDVTVWEPAPSTIGRRWCGQVKP